MANLNLEWAVLGTAVAVVALGILGTWYLGGVLGVARAQRLLIACGFSICGAAAVAAVEGVADAGEEETFTAIALVVVFGFVMIPVVPALSALLGLSPVDAGIWAGAPIHEVAQVVAAGSAIGGTAGAGVHCRVGGLRRGPLKWNCSRGWHRCGAPCADRATRRGDVRLGHWRHVLHAARSWLAS